MASFIAKLVSGALPLFGELPPDRTNGQIGNWQGLPDFLGGNPPWGSGSYDGHTVGQQPPNTGVTRRYDWNISRARLAPDGYEKDMIVINGQYPGPMIEANWGDWIEVTVTNSIRGPEEGTTIHWHALLQKGTQAHDGVPGLSQCPIAPGSRFTYRFRADHVGSTWYHSHYSAQLAAGLTGPIVFHGPKSYPYHRDLGPVLINDWFHGDYHALVKKIMGRVGIDKGPAFSDNNLINGKMNFDCTLVTDGTPCTSNAGVSKFKFEEGKDHLLRVINGGSAGLQYFSVDEHELTVISNDFIPIKPYKTNYITLGVGQRADVVVRGKRGPDARRAYWMRNNISTICALPRQPYGLAAIYYGETDYKSATKTPSSQPQVFSEQRLLCGNEPLNVTEPLKPVPAKPADKTIHIDIASVINATGHEEYLLNNKTFRVNYNQPMLRLASDGNLSYPFSSHPEWNLYDTGRSKVVRVVWENQKVDPQDPNLFNITFSHPMHLHGHDFQVLAAGPGRWDGTVVNGGANPLRRDTHILPLNGHLVVQFETDNPGIWPFHCHVAWHVSQGFAVNLLERPDDIPGNRRQIAGVMEQTCKGWDAWTKKNVVEQIDSGWRRMSRETDR